MMAISSDDAETVALQAIAWIIGNDDIRDRFLSLSGIDVSELAERLQDRAFLAAILDFLLSHEPDLLACCEDTGLDPELPLIAAGALSGSPTHWT